MELNSEFFITLAALIAGAGLAGWMYVLEKRPRTGLSPRLFPTTLVLLAGLLLAVGAGVHLFALAGFKIPQR